MVKMTRISATMTLTSSPDNAGYGNLFALTPAVLQRGVAIVTQLAALAGGAFTVIEAA